ncbi:hypothetical protein BJ684DRAFT_18596 [Piptocephalis cylindrospora]|uniref:DUF2470 domain-containing protein n=1 Tax=Piptocephalis cylindrospora TaxID=1907219 RepID=A0A4P9Y7J3_9FUNG|nr:hypothetical protein BJ684DRAFT_18596 [Piptocephalis cylindrospora]|eukprot:RKP15048.1 hypothetical protein BJ684DRAFT_18596 [Piptocephalis cylindrospora]
MAFRIRRQGPRSGRSQEGKTVDPRVQRELESLQATLNSPEYRQHRLQLACLGTGVRDPPHSVVVSAVDAEGLTLQCRGGKGSISSAKEEECHLLYREPARTLEDVRHQLKALQVEAGQHMGQAGSPPTPVPLLRPAPSQGLPLLIVEIVLLFLLFFSHSYTSFASRVLTIGGTVHLAEATLTLALCLYRGYAPMVTLYYTIGVLPFGITLLYPIYSIPTAI